MDYGFNFQELQKIVEQVKDVEEVKDDYSIILESLQ